MDMDRIYKAMSSSFSDAMAELTPEQKAEKEAKVKKARTIEKGTFYEKEFKLIEKDLSKFLDREVEFNNFQRYQQLKVMLDVLPKDIIVAGGFILSLIVDTTAGDVDMWFGEPKSFRNTYDILTKDFGYELNVKDLGKLSKKTPDELFLNDTVHQIKLVPTEKTLEKVNIGRLPYPIQLLKTGWFTEVEPLLKRFDFSCCQLAFTKGNFYYNQRSLKDIKNKELIPCYVNESTTIYRLTKYYQKGFTVRDNNVLADLFTKSAQKGMKPMGLSKKSREDVPVAAEDGGPNWATVTDGVAVVPMAAPTFTVRYDNFEAVPMAPTDPNPPDGTPDIGELVMTNRIYIPGAPIEEIRDATTVELDARIRELTGAAEHIAAETLAYQAPAGPGTLNIQNGGVTEEMIENIRVQFQTAVATPEATTPPQTEGGGFFGHPTFTQDIRLGGVLYYGDNQGINPWGTTQMNTPPPMDPPAMPNGYDRECRCALCSGYRTDAERYVLTTGRTILF